MQGIRTQNQTITLLSFFYFLYLLYFIFLFLLISFFSLQISWRTLQEETIRCSSFYS